MRNQPERARRLRYAAGCTCAHRVARIIHIAAVDGGTTRKELLDHIRTLLNTFGRVLLGRPLQQVQDLLWHLLLLWRILPDDVDDAARDRPGVDFVALDGNELQLAIVRT